MRARVVKNQGRSDGEYIGIYTPQISVYPPPKLCGCSVSLQGLVNIYTHPNQIPGYASVKNTARHGFTVEMQRLGQTDRQTDTVSMQ